MPRVTAILVVRNGEQWLDRTLAALAAQTRRPEALVVVDAGSSDGSAAKLTAADATQFVTAPASNYGAAVGAGLRASAPDAADEWLWLLAADTAPEPDALRELLAAVEIAPSVAIAGPKLVDSSDRRVLHAYGESLSQLGATVPLVVDGELDQAQHDANSDVLAVAAAGMLVRRAVWNRLGGFDPGLPHVDAGLDLSIRARLAGSRVIRVPSARVTRGRRPEDFGRKKPASARVRRRLARTAQLHRRLVYASAAAVPFHWLALLPLAVLRSVGLLFAKRPGAVAGEFGAAFAAAFDGSVLPARSRLRRSRTLGWATIAPLRVPRDQRRELAAATRDQEVADRPVEPVVRASFLPGGISAVAIAALVGIGMWWGLFGAAALSGGALLPLASDPAELWSRLGWGWREIGVGFEGPADPFTGVLAVLGSLTWWAPSTSLVVLWLTALPLAALGAWWCATRLSSRRWPPVIAALLWAFAPPLLIALIDGRPAAVIAHLLLPWLVLAALEGARSWSAAAGASLLFAAVTACAPVIFPVLLVALLFWAFARPRALVRLIGIAIPAAVLFLPLVLVELRRGTPLASVIDPGAVVPFDAPSGWELLLGDPDGAAAGWAGLLELTGIPSDNPVAAILPALLLAPLAVFALLAAFVPGARRSIPALALALAGLATAVAAANLMPASAGALAVGPWPGTALSVYWLGLVGAVVVALHALGRAAVWSGLIITAAAALAVAPIAVAPHLEPSMEAASDVRAGSGRQLPAIVLAEAANDPAIGTLRLDPQPDGSLAAVIQRGEGTTLDDQSTVQAGRIEPNDDERMLAELAGNLASHSGYDPTPALDHFRLKFVLLPAIDDAADPDAIEVRQRAAEALDATPELDSVGESAFGTLWRFSDLEAGEAPAHERSTVGLAVLVVQGIVIGVALVLAIPTGRRRPVVTDAPELDELPTFEGDPDD